MLGAELGITPTCGQLEQILSQVPAKTDICRLSQGINYLCGCNEGQRIYFDADTETRKRALAWVRRVSAPTCQQLEQLLSQVPASNDACRAAHSIYYLCGFNDGQRINVNAGTETTRLALAQGPRVSSLLAMRCRRGEQKRDKSTIEMMEQQTFWQAVAYLGAFYLVWPILLVSILYDFDSYAFAFVSHTLGPIQGFLNCLVYFRPRFQEYRRARAKQQRRAVLAVRPEQESKEGKSTSLTIPELGSSDLFSMKAQPPALDLVVVERPEQAASAFEL